MKNQLEKVWMPLGVAALLAQSLVFSACSSANNTGGTGGTTSVNGSGGSTTGAQGGSSGTAGSSGTGAGICVDNPGTCTTGDCSKVNPDTLGSGACTSGCESSSSCSTPCTQDCCVPCGIDGAGTKVCTCMTPGLPFNNCTCSPPPGFPTGLTGGTCMPQGYSATMAPAGSISLKGMPCNILNAVCFTAESTMTSGRGCICMADVGGGMSLHCGSVNKWFSQVAGTTVYMQ